MKANSIVIRLTPLLKLCRAAVAVVLLVAGVAGLAASATLFMRVRIPWSAPTVILDRLPTGIAFEKATNTIYVANSNSNTVTVIDASQCNASNTSHCVPVATMPDVGLHPDAVAIDRASHTLYVTNGLEKNGADGRRIAIMNIAACNAHDTSGCNQPPVGLVFTQGRMENGDTGNIAAIVLDPFTHTLYVGDAHDGPVSIINTATCNSTTLSGCKDKLTTNVNGDAVIIDRSNHSVYAGRVDDGSFVVFNGTTCNAQTQSDCSAVSVAQLPAGFGVIALGEIESHTKTLYLPLVASDELGYVA
jgi:DNA-binding beta-propeller fold protein YncE